MSETTNRRGERRRWRRKRSSRTRLRWTDGKGGGETEQERRTERGEETHSAHVQFLGSEISLEETNERKQKRKEKKEPEPVEDTDQPDQEMLLVLLADASIQR